MAFGKNTAADILSQKQNRPAAYNRQFDEAVSLVTNTIDNLGSISHNIAQTMQEIEDYERELATTKEGLAEAKAKNDRVIANFQSLLAVN